MKTALTWISMVLAVAAAMTALFAARVKTPRSITLRAVQYDEYAEAPIQGPVPEHQAGTIVGPDLSLLTQSIRRQGFWSFVTAACAGASAVAQIAAFVVKE
jgi:hypothetical protein